jgi:hypothetical protein
MSPKFYVGVAVLLLIIDAMLFAFGWLADDQLEDFRFELFKLLFNGAILVIGGGLIKQALDEQRALESFRVEVTKVLGEIHSTIYVARRQLRMAGSDPKLVETCIIEIMKARAALGSLGHHLRTRRDVGQQAVIDNIRVVRAYLEDIVEETVAIRQRGSDLGLGPKLEAFLAHEPVSPPEGASPPPSDYQLHFKAPYLRAKIAADPSWQTTEEQEMIAKLPPPERRVCAATTADVPEQPRGDSDSGQD